MISTTKERQPAPRIRDTRQIAEVARLLRRKVIELVAPTGQGYVQQGLGAADLFAVLYFAEMRLDPADPDFEHRYWLMRRMRSMFRVKGVSWWAEEMPSQAEYQEALANLERVNWTVDCVLTHCAPSGVVQKINPSYGTDELTDFLEMVSQRCKFAYWFFGHYHENRIIDQKYILQWEKISELGF